MVDSITSLPFVQQATYYSAYAEYLMRYGQWWWSQHQTEVMAGAGAVAAGLVGLRLAWSRWTTRVMRIAGAQHGGRGLMKLRVPDSFIRALESSWDAMVPGIIAARCARRTMPMRRCSVRRVHGKPGPW